MTYNFRLRRDFTVRQVLAAARPAQARACLISVLRSGAGPVITSSEARASECVGCRLLRRTCWNSPASGCDRGRSTLVPVSCAAMRPQHSIPGCQLRRRGLSWRDQLRGRTTRRFCEKSAGCCGPAARPSSAFANRLNLLLSDPVALVKTPREKVPLRARQEEAFKIGRFLDFRIVRASRRGSRRWASDSSSWKAWLRASLGPSLFRRPAAVQRAHFDPHQPRRSRACSPRLQLRAHSKWR